MAFVSVDCTVFTSLPNLLTVGFSATLEGRYPERKMVVHQDPTKPCLLCQVVNSAWDRICANCIFRIVLLSLRAHTAV